MNIIRKRNRRRHTPIPGLAIYIASFNSKRYLNRNMVELGDRFTVSEPTETIHNRSRMTATAFYR